MIFILERNINLSKCQVKSKINQMVGTGGFEPSASCSQSKRSTRLSYVPFIFANSVIIIQRLCSPTSFAKLSVSYIKLPNFFYFASLLYKTLIMKTIYA